MRAPLSRTRKLVLLLVLTGTMVMSGCWVTSMEPYLEETDYVEEPRLLDAWTGDCTGSDMCTITISAGSRPKSLEFTFEHPKGKESFEGYVAEFGGRRFVQLFPNDSLTETGHQRPVYTVWRLSLEKDTLTLTPISSDWFEEEFKAGRIKPSVSPLRTKIFDSEMIVMLTFTAPTNELREFVKAHAANDQVFAKGITVQRKR